MLSVVEPPRFISADEIASRKQAWRDEDARALAAGEKSVEQLRAENSIVGPLGPPRVPRLQGSKPLR